MNKVYKQNIYKNKQLLERDLQNELVQPISKFAPDGFKESLKFNTPIETPEENPIQHDDNRDIKEDSKGNEIDD